MKEISSLKHPFVQHLVRLKTDRKYRYEQKSVLLEGRNSILDVGKKHLLKSLILGPQEKVPQGITANEIYVVTEQVIDKISSVESPDAIIAELAMPEFTSLTSTKRIVACDGIQDPGNLGTLIRTALALGWEGVYLIDPCCDPFNDKALRAAKGATFDIKLQKGSWEDLSLFPHTKLIATLYGSSPESYVNEERVILILGNESKGVIPPKDFSYKNVSIPMSGAMESLNVAVAGSILMYALQGARKTS